MDASFGSLLRPAIVGGILLLAHDARADDEAHRRIAQALFDEARTLMDAGRYAEACPKLAESQRLDPGGGTLLNLAVCREQEGKSATAWTLFHDALGEAKRDGRADRETLAREHIEKLSPKLARVRIRLATAGRDVPGLVVSVDRVEIGSGAYESAIPIDPGGHRVAADAPGYRSWERDVNAEPGSTVDVEVPPLQLDRQPSPFSAVPQPTRVNPAYVAALVATGVALTVSAVTGTIWFVRDTATDKPTAHGCFVDRKFCRDEAGIDYIQGQYNLALTSTIAGGLAMAGVVAIVILPARVKDARVTISPLGSAAAGAAAQVSF